MNRTWSLVAAPELLLGVVALVVYLGCARNPSYAESEVRMLERFLLWLPLLVVSVGFVGGWMSEVRSGAWLLRANLAAMLCLVVCTGWVVSGFGAPGSGPKGQDVGFLLAVSGGTLLCAGANAYFGTRLLREARPGFDLWYREHSVLAPLLSIGAVIPLFILQLLVVMFVVGVGAAAFSAFKR